MTFKTFEKKFQSLIKTYEEEKDCETDESLNKFYIATKALALLSIEANLDFNKLVNYFPTISAKERRDIVMKALVEKHKDVCPAEVGVAI